MSHLCPWWNLPEFPLPWLILAAGWVFSAFNALLNSSHTSLFSTIWKDALVVDCSVKALWTNTRSLLLTVMVWVRSKESMKGTLVGVHLRDAGKHSIGDRPGALLWHLILHTMISPLKHFSHKYWQHMYAFFQRFFWALTLYPVTLNAGLQIWWR